MEVLNKLTPRVTKRTLLLIAGLVWGFAGFRVFTIGISDVVDSGGNLLINLVISSLVFYIFFKFIFSKMFRKHTRRILKNLLDKQCAFSFFDVKGYCIMTFMITFGVLVRSSGIFNPVYVGTFYIGLGFALFMAGVLFLSSYFDFEKTKVKYAS